MLGRVGDRGMTMREPAQRRAVYDEVRRLALERYDWDVERFLPFHLQVRSRLLRAGRLDALEALAAAERTIVAKARTTRVERDDGTLVVAFDARLAGAGRPRFRRAGERWLWEPPEALRGILDDDARDATKALAKRVTVLVLAKHAGDRTEFRLPASTEVRMVATRDDPELFAPVVSVRATLDPRTAAAGAPLPPALWNLYALVNVVGFDSMGRIPDPDARDGRVLGATVTAKGRLAAPPLRLRVASRAPWLARTLRPVARALARE
jgi:hypothetical protein